jgi:hypothetical protein
MESVAMIEFNGIDIIIQHQVDEGRVRRALAAALHVPEGHVALINDISHYPKAGDAEIVCVSSQVEGEFANLLSIQVDRTPLPYDTHAQLMQALCERLGVQYITPDDDDVDPYVMWFVSPGAVPRRVGLDPIALDEGRYVIARRV